jgi:SAM-dependent methyltransferase
MTQGDLESRWKRGNVWRLSPFVRTFLKKAKARFERPSGPTGAPWPNDDEGVAKNLTYLFPGHLMKMNKVMCQVLGDEESLRYLSQTDEFIVLDLACGPGMASIATLDFLIQAFRAEKIDRESPLTVSFCLNDLKKPCVEAAIANLRLAAEMLRKETANVQVGSVDACAGPLTEVVSLMTAESRRSFDLICFSNAFDHVLIYGERVLLDYPTSKDAIAHARPCDRPKLLAEFLQGLGQWSNPFFSRAIFLQEWRHSPLMPIALPSRDLKVVKTMMEQEAVRPDVEKETLYTRFAYAGCRYGYSLENGRAIPTLQTLPIYQDWQSAFSEEGTRCQQGDMHSHWH